MPPDPNDPKDALKRQEMAKIRQQSADALQAEEQRKADLKAKHMEEASTAEAEGQAFVEEEDRSVERKGAGLKTWRANRKNTQQEMEADKKRREQLAREAEEKKRKQQQKEQAEMEAKKKLVDLDRTMSKRRAESEAAERSSRQQVDRDAMRKKMETEMETKRTKFAIDNDLSLRVRQLRSRKGMQEEKTDDAS